MFGRRVFASAPLPRHMWARMHVQNAAQAQRMLPSLAPLTASLGRSVNVLNSQALTQARDGMASETTTSALDELLTMRCIASSPVLLNALFCTAGKFAVSVNMPLVSFLEMCKLLCNKANGCHAV